MQSTSDGSAHSGTPGGETPLNVEVMKWIDEAARANAAFQAQCADALERQATVFLHLLLAGAGGALAYAVNLGEKQAAAWQQGGMWAAAAWLFAVAALLIARALWSRPIFGPANDPKHMAPGYRMALGDVLRFELEHRQASIEANRARNNMVGRWLNICRGLAAATPLVFALVAALSAIKPGG